MSERIGALAGEGVLSPGELAGLREQLASAQSHIVDLQAEVKRCQDNERFLNSIVELIPDMIFVKDAVELRFVRFNAAGARLLGHAQADILGKSDRDFFPADEAAFFIKKDREVLSSGGVLDIPEEPIHTATGLRYLHTKKIPIADDAGRPLYLLGISEDITERKEAAERLAEAQEALRVLLTPVLQIRSGLLILPIVGPLDSERARRLTEQLLREIRANRSRVVILDITGVPSVDAAVANHLVLTVEASRLSGARTMVSGISAAVAQTLVEIHIDPMKIPTVSDLQSGIEEAERILGYRVTRDAGSGGYAE